MKTIGLEIKENPKKVEQEKQKSEKDSKKNDKK